MTLSEVSVMDEVRSTPSRTKVSLVKPDEFITTSYIPMCHVHLLLPVPPSGVRFVPNPSQHT